MTVADRIAITSHPRFPTLPDFEAVVDRGKSPGVYRRTFVRMFFDEMLKRRMNFNMEDAIHEIALKAAQSLDADYMGAVSFDGYANLHPHVSYENVASFVSRLSFNDATMQTVIDECLEYLILTVDDKFAAFEIGLLGIFEYPQGRPAIQIAYTWLDYIELLHGTVEYNRLVGVRRHLTILCRSYELLVRQVVTKQGHGR